MADEDKDARTEAATPKRLQQAREEGRAPVSRDAAMAVALAVTVLVLSMSAPQSGRSLALALKGLLSLDRPPIEALHQAAWAGLAALAPLVGALLVAGVGGGLLQTGGLVSAASITPKFGKLNPFSGLARLFGPDNLVEAIKSVAKLGILGTVTWQALTGVLPDLSNSVLWTPDAMLDKALRHMVHLLLLLLGGQGVIAAVDILWTRLRHARSLRMSREDIRQEHKQSEGDPHIKGRLKQMRLARARRRMMAAVPKAMVVITNPTHYAVALAYDQGVQGAPRVVAKGMDEVAARIRALAQQSGVPLIANPPLARALYTVQLDAEIPADQFQAVAEIIAYVWRLRGSMRPAA